MGYARSIGRIGALAVALGVGYAVSDATALAESTDSSSSRDSATASSARPSATGRAAVTPSTRGPVRRAAAQNRIATTVTTSGPTPRSVAGLAPPRVPASLGEARPAAVAAVPRVEIPAAPAPLPSAAVTPTVVEPTQAPAAPADIAASGAAPTPPPVRAATSVAPAAIPPGTTNQVISEAPDPLPAEPADSPAAAPLLLTTAAWTRREARGAVARNTAATLTAASLLQTPDVLEQSPNLLVNPGAEFGDPSLSGFSAVTMPGWTVTGTPTVIKYGTPRSLWPIGTSFPMPNLPSFLGFPTANSGPPDGGNQFFGGGDVTTGTLTQTVDLRGAADEIDQGSTTYNLSGWLGGFIFDPSGSSVEVDFLDANKTYLGSAKLNRVGALDRWFQTGFKQRSTAGTLPVGTRYAEVVVNLEDRRPLTFGIPFLFGGVDFDYNNAYADNISFSISADLPAPPAPTPPVSTVGELDHLFMVYMENKGYNDIVNSTQAPFLNSLINAYGHANNYYGLTHPSLPNYYPVIGGTDFGLTYNCATPCIDADTTLVSNITAAGKTWRGYAQSLQPGANPLVAAGDYSPDQLPFPAFESIANDPEALANVVPLEQMAEDLKSVDTAPNYAWFAANEDFNGEGPIDFPWGILRFAISQLTPGNPYNIPALDQFLSETVPVVLNSAVWNDPTRKSALIVTFDEDNNNTSLGFGNEGNRVVFVVIPSQGAVAAGMRSDAFVATNHYNHYSLLRMIEDSLGLPNLTNNDLFAAPLNEFWDGTGTSGSVSVL